MALPLLEDHRDLAEAVAAFANRFGGIADTRSNVKRYAAGDRPGLMGWIGPSGTARSAPAGAIRR